MTISATEFKTNLGKYIDYIASSDEEIIVTKNGKKFLVSENLWLKEPNGLPAS